MGKFTSAILFAMLSAGALGHMEMVNPLPIRSPNDPKSNNPDYDYVSPLDASGSNFPCKGYHTDPFRSTADYQPGQSYTMEIEGGATHEGGSCQLSLSYDQGETFKVIKSMIGGCPLQSSYDFTIPSDAPAGEALFAWSWFNKVGNREMYMNCAFVTIGGGGSKLRARQETSLALESAPSIFIANVNGPGQCTTIEGEDVDFPYPGDEVETGTQASGEGYTCSGEAPGAPDGDAPNPPSPPTDPAPVPTSEPTPVPTPTTTMVTFPPPTPTGTPAPPPGGECTEGETVCNSPTTWSLCSGGHLVFMGDVAPGMTCNGGSINRAPY